MIGVGERVAPVRVDLQRDVGADLGAHRGDDVDVVAGRDLQLQAPVPERDVRGGVGRELRRDRRRAGRSRRRRRTCVRGAAEVRRERDRLGAELGVEHRTGQRGPRRVVAAHGVETARRRTGGARARRGARAARCRACRARTWARSRRRPRPNRRRRRSRRARAALPCASSCSARCGTAASAGAGCERARRRGRVVARRGSVHASGPGHSARAHERECFEDTFSAAWRACVRGAFFDGLLGSGLLLGR